ncbi:hypothetical protein ACHAQE_009066 [Botrytis cinerea]
MTKEFSGATLLHFVAKGRPNYVDYRGSESIAIIIRYLILKGVDIAALELFHRAALYVVARYNQNSFLPILVNAGTPTNTQNSKEDTALSLAAGFPYRYSSGKDVKDLLSLGADPSIVNNNGLTALDQAWKAYVGSHVNKNQLRTSKVNVEILTTALRVNVSEDIWRLFIDNP